MDELKFTDAGETQLRGLLAPYGGPFNGSDIQGERFSARTDFVLDWFTERPLLYQHGLDPRTGVAVVGRIKATERDDMGLWMQAQLDAASQYYDAIRQLVKAGKLKLSSGSMRHLVQVDDSGEIRRWPLIEGSLTPTPANPLADVDFATVKSHYDAIAVDMPDAIKAVLNAEQRNELSDGDFAYIDSQGGRHLPMNDAEHARAALSRFNQTQFESDAAKAKAKRRLIARCKQLGIDVSPDFAKSADMHDLICAVMDAKSSTAFMDLGISELADFVRLASESLGVRTRDVHQRRTQEERSLSPDVRSHVGDCLTVWATERDGLLPLLSTGPALVGAGAAAVLRTQAQLEAMRLRLLAM